MKVSLPAYVTACTIVAGVVATVALASSPSPKADSQAFSSAMSVAIDRMHHGMMGPLSGDLDRDFASMMIPHHQGAIDMAKVQLLYGRDAALRRLAQKIIVEQGQEIAVMQRFVDQDPMVRDERAGTSTHRGDQ